MEDRATIFGGEADTYHSVRPRYPSDVIDLLVDDEPTLLVDAGCGTGIASRQVAARGVRVLGVEPDARMASIARSGGIEVTVSPLEDWKPKACDGLYAAQSWHWIDPDRGARVAAGAIGSGGRWTACWNVDVFDDVRKICDEVYRQHAPELVRDRSGAHQANDEFEDRVSSGLRGTNCFEPLEKHVFAWVDRIEPRRYAQRLDSQSNHRLLADDHRRRILSALVDAFGERNELSVDYQTVVFTAVRR